MTKRAQKLAVLALCFLVVVLSSFYFWSRLDKLENHNLSVAANFIGAYLEFFKDEVGRYPNDWSEFVESKTFRSGFPAEIKEGVRKLVALPSFSYHQSSEPPKHHPLFSVEIDGKLFKKYPLDDGSEAE